MSRTDSATTNTVILGIVSAGIAFVLFYFLESSAQFQNSVINAGGAVAGFLCVFWLLSNHYKNTARSAEITRIEELEAEIKDLNERIAQKQLKVNLYFDPKPAEPFLLNDDLCTYSVRNGIDQEGKLQVALSEGGWQCKLPPECEEKRVKLTLIDANGDTWEVSRTWPVMSMKAIKR
jgi:hypothetical protein